MDDGLFIVLDLPSADSLNLPNFISCFSRDEDAGHLPYCGVPYYLLVMFATSIILLATTLMPSASLEVHAFVSLVSLNKRRGKAARGAQIVISTPFQSHSQPRQRLHARGTVGSDDNNNNIKDEEEDDDERDVVYATRRSGRWAREEKEIYDDTFKESSQSSSSRYQNDVDFFDFDDNYNDDDDDELFDYDELFDGENNNRMRNKIDDIKYNGIIPNPLLDAMDPDGVYERLGPELFKDWTFFRDMALFALFLTFFTSDTHLYGTFDSVIERLEDLPADFIPMN